MTFLFSNICPQCGQGEIFRGFVTMHDYCPVCSFRFEREEGYFTGALFLNYIFLACGAIPTLLIALLLKVPIVPAALLAIFQIVGLSPFALRFSRLFWIQMDYRSDPAHKRTKTRP